MITDVKQDTAGMVSRIAQLSLCQHVAASLQGSSRWLVVISFVHQALFTVLAAVAIVQFFRAESVRDLIAYAAAFLVCLVAIATLKLWYWMELNKNALIREFRHLEQQINRAIQGRDDR